LTSTSGQNLMASPFSTLAPTLLGERLAARDALWKVVRENPEFDRLSALLVNRFASYPAPAPDTGSLWVDIIDYVMAEAITELMHADVDGKTAKEIDAFLEPAVLDAPAPVTTNAFTTFASYAKKAKKAMGFVPTAISMVMISRISKEGADIAGQAAWKVVLEAYKTKITSVVMTQKEFDNYEMELNKLLDRTRGNPDALKEAKKDFEKLVKTSQTDGGLKPGAFTGRAWKGAGAIFNLIGLAAAGQKGTDSAADFCGFIGATDSAGRSVLAVMDAWKPGGSIGKFLAGTERISGAFGSVLGILTGVVQIAEGLQQSNPAAIAAGAITVGGAAAMAFEAIFAVNPIIATVGGVVMLVASFIDTDNSPPPAQQYLTQQFERTADIGWFYESDDPNASRKTYHVKHYASGGLAYFAQALNNDPSLLALYADFYRAVKAPANGNPNKAAFRAMGKPLSPTAQTWWVSTTAQQIEALRILGVSPSDAAHMVRA
jgi:hypothetical protein